MSAIEASGNSAVPKYEWIVVPFSPFQVQIPETSMNPYKVVFFCFQQSHENGHTLRNRFPQEYFHVEKYIMGHATTVNSQFMRCTFFSLTRQHLRLRFYPTDWGEEEGPTQQGHLVTTAETQTFSSEPIQATFSTRFLFLPTTRQPISQTKASEKSTIGNPMARKRTFMRLYY